MFSIVAIPVYSPTHRVQVFPFLYILAKMLFVDFLIIDVLTGMRWYRVNGGSLAPSPRCLGS